MTKPQSPENTNLNMLEESNMEQRGAGEKTRICAADPLVPLKVGNETVDFFIR